MTARRVGRAMVVVGAAGALLGTFLPWMASGSVDRSSYDLIDLVERLGYSPDGAMGVAVSAWPFAPLLLVVSIVGSWLHGRVPRTLVVGWWLVTAVFVGGAAIGVLGAPDPGILRIRYGLWVSLAGAALVLAGGVVEIALATRRPISPARPTDRARSARP